MYKQWIEENGAKVLEMKHGFATYYATPDCFYVEDIYVVPEERKNGKSQEIGEELEKIAKELEYDKIYGTINLLNDMDKIKRSQAMLEKAGYKLDRTELTAAIFVKEVE